MRNSVSPFGIRIDDWVDERRDFWKSTDAAFRKLEENYRYFGDWPMALAAYNAGLGALKRASAKAGTNDYWTLCEKGYLKTETVHYVPKLLAAATVLSRAGRVGIDLGWPEDPKWTRVDVGRTVDLSLLAEKAGIDAARLRSGNLELRYGVTPPDKGYQLKVRADDAALVEATLARKDLQLIRYYFHVIRSGDTLSALSRHYGVSVDMIVRSNPGLDARFLKLGSRVLVPAFKEVGPYEREKTIDSTIVFSGTHLVKKGETLWSIALAYEVDPEALAEANGMELSSILREGRELKTPIRKAEAQ
jgi:membrane-bound lytic murein transglycosylase D